MGRDDQVWDSETGAGEGRGGGGREEGRCGCGLGSEFGAEEGELSSSECGDVGGCRSHGIERVIGMEDCVGHRFRACVLTRLDLRSLAVRLAAVYVKVSLIAISYVCMGVLESEHIVT